MEKRTKIPVEECCMYYEVETAFIQQLDEHGLIELIHYGKEVFIAYEQLPYLEKYKRLHYDMDINWKGLETIQHLLNRVQALQQEIKRLRNELEQGPAPAAFGSF